MGQYPNLSLCVSFAIGALVMRSAGCTINDLWDYEIDRQVERTKSRPLASGALSPKQAIIFLGIQLLSGLGVLLTFNSSTIIIGKLIT